MKTLRCALHSSMDTASTPATDCQGCVGQEDGHGEGCVEVRACGHSEDECQGRWLAQEGRDLGDKLGRKSRALSRVRDATS